MHRVDQQWFEAVLLEVDREESIGKRRDDFLERRDPNSGPSVRKVVDGVEAVPGVQ